MKRLDRPQSLILLTAIVMLAGFGGLRYWPLLRQRHVLAAQMEQQSLQMEEIRQYSSLLPELRHRQRDLEDHLRRFTTQIPAQRDFAGLWQQIADAMNTCALREPWVQPGAETRSGRLCCIPVTIECKGSLEQVFAFCKSLEGMERLVRMEEMKLENSAELNAELKMKARVAVYYQPETM
ncbi:MAG: type 4a pilus biogenesis protein PilO [Planctomycetaceae bacterium]|nr:type 4a pilus biogenesis protein PilO [Planctomycetaceae bacterium]